VRPVGADKRAQVRQSPAMRQEIDLLDGDGAAEGIALAHRSKMVTAVPA
jgi:hypothetical protein